MTEYVAFIGQMPRYGSSEYWELKSYLESLFHLGMMGETKEARNIVRPEGLELVFPGDGKIKDLISGMELPPIYDVLRMEIKNKKQLNRNIKKFCERYKLEHRIYEV